jgi:hypothetical protein
MRENLVFYMPWLLSAITIYMTVLAGNKTRWAWAIGLANQAHWLVWIFAAQAWGLLPMNIALWIVYSRNHLKWMRAERPV